MCKSNEVESRMGKIYIGKDCFLGIGVLVLPNVNVGFGAIVSAGATIKKDVKELGPKNVTNALFVGSTTELQKMIKKNKDKK